MIDLLGKDDEVHFENLPVELQGKDLKPDEMEKLRNDFPVMKKRIIITFSENQEDELKKILGTGLLDLKHRNLFSLEEIEGARNGLL